MLSFKIDIISGWFKISTYPLYPIKSINSAFYPFSSMLTLSMIWFYTSYINWLYEILGVEKWKIIGIFDKFKWKMQLDLKRKRIAVVEMDLKQTAFTLNVITKGLLSL